MYMCIHVHVCIITIYIAYMYMCMHVCILIRLLKRLLEIVKADMKYIHVHVHYTCTLHNISTVPIDPLIGSTNTVHCFSSV